MSVEPVILSVREESREEAVSVILSASEEYREEAVSVILSASEESREVLSDLGANKVAILLHHAARREQRFFGR